MAEEKADVYLRFDGIKADCRDVMHPGDFDKIVKSSKANAPKHDGWMAVKHFTFGFGWEGGGEDLKDGGMPEKMKQGLRAKHYSEEQIKELDKQWREEHKNETKAKAGKSSKEGHRLKPKPFTFSKYPDAASDDLMAKVIALEDRKVGKVVLEMCRPSNADRTQKIAFFRLILEDVTIVKCGLQISGDPNPTEDITFEFEKATMQSLWTSNATGDKQGGDMQSAGWDFGIQRGEQEDSDPGADNGQEYTGSAD